jgi:hypothetical protein
MLDLTFARVQEFHLRFVYVEAKNLEPYSSIAQRERLADIAHAYDPDHCFALSEFLDQARDDGIFSVNGHNSLPGINA